MIENPKIGDYFVYESKYGGSVAGEIKNISFNPFMQSYSIMSTNGVSYNSDEITINKAKERNIKIDNILGFCQPCYFKQFNIKEYNKHVNNKRRFK